MRRRIKKNNLIFLVLFFIAFFTGLSFIFDQRGVQQENTIRQFDTKISNLKIRIQEEMFIHNSLIELSKDIKYSIQIQKNILDVLYVHRPWFEDHLEFELRNESGERFTQLRGGKEAFQRLLKIYKDNFLKLFHTYNSVVNDFYQSINSFKKNGTLIKLSSEYELDILKIDILGDYIIKDKEINDIPIDYIVPAEDRATNNSPIDKFYSDYRDRMHSFSQIGLYTLEIAEDLSLLQNDNFDEYTKLLKDFTNSKNKKNLYILLSIFFQILSLTSIMILFKIVVSIEKK